MIRARRRWSRFAFPATVLALPAMLLAQPTTVPSQGGMTLTALLALAKSRAERQRPAQAEKLKPFLADLALNYPDNKAFLDGRVAEVAQLGDGIVPLLLELLAPADDSQEKRQLAANSARVLQLLEPSGFTDALLELLGGRSHVARLHAISLLGWTRSRNAAQKLTALLPDLQGEALLRALDALRRLRAADATGAVSRYLASPDKAVREATLEFLIEVRAAGALEPVLMALAGEKHAPLLPRYVEYLASTAPANAAAADALVPLLAGDKLDKVQVTGVVTALATIAPAEHAPTLGALRQMLQQDETGALGRAAALTMRDLGDKKGLSILFDNLNAKVQKRKKESQVYEQRGDAFFAIGKWAEAARDYEEAIANARSKTLESFLHLKVAKTEARRARWSNVLAALKAAEPTWEILMREAERDEGLRKALEEKSIRKFADALPGAPKK